MENRYVGPTFVVTKEVGNHVTIPIAKQRRKRHPHMVALLLSLITAQGPAVHGAVRTQHHLRNCFCQPSSLVAVLRHHQVLRMHQPAKAVAKRIGSRRIGDMGFLNEGG